jgi:hypothetical protein
MPNAFGKLTDDERKQVDDWLVGKSKVLCPQCQKGNCKLDDYVVQVPVRIDPRSQGYALALVTIICRVCAFIRFFDARAIGVLPAY